MFFVGHGILPISAAAFCLYCNKTFVLLSLLLLFVVVVFYLRRYQARDSLLCLIRVYSVQQQKIVETAPAVSYDKILAA